MIISAFGSDMNGAAAAISEFLGYITLLEAGVGGVTRAALFKPLSQMDTVKISGIVNATEGFFRKLALLFFVYTLGLACVFKYISHTELEWFFTFSLVITLSISVFAQYYFGITYSILLQADQNQYIPNGVQMLTTILNTLLSVILLKLGCGFLFVKMATASVFTLRPIFLNYFAKKRYQLDKRVPPDYDAIQQRWNGLGQHLAFFITQRTDITVVTLFLGLKSVSVYSVYYMVLNGVYNISSSICGSFESAFGNMIAKEEDDILRDRFHMMETLTSIVALSLFSTTGILLFDFIRLYTSDVADADYIIIPFGILFVISNGLYSIKQNYHSLVLAAGHYKQTQVAAYVEAALNVVLSCLFVKIWGISGTIVATIIASAYKIIYYMLYLKKAILFRPIRITVVRMLVNFIVAVSCVGYYFLFAKYIPGSYFAWIMKAIPAGLVCAGNALFWNWVCYRRDVRNMFCKVWGFLKA